MNQYKLEKYSGPSSRYACPSCGQPRKFSRYVDTRTGQHVAPHVGRCERIDSCGYHYSPRMYYDEHPDLRTAASVRQPIVQPSRPAVAAEPETSYMSYEHFDRSWQHISDNHFLQYLYAHYDRALVDRAFADYLIGSSEYWPGATVFWQMDAQQRLRTGKIMLYDRDTGRRVKEPFSHITWAHTAAGERDFRLRQCLFGEYLLCLARLRHHPVAICESEKCAIICSMIVPEYLWMATGGKEGLTADKLRPLQGRKVTLYPDSGAYELWSRRAKELGSVVEMKVSRIMEGRPLGMDMADYLTGNLKAKT